MIETTVVGDEEVLLSVNTQLKDYLNAIRTGVRTAGLRTEGVVKRKLSGEVLKRRSGRLSAGVHTTFEETETEFTATTGIGPELRYGKVHELGGTFTVKEHLRMQKKAWGRDMKNPRQVTVKAHSATYPKRSFLATSSAETAERNIAGVKSAIEQVKPQ